jgi:ribulose-phosphate 3-epimerase
MVDAPESFFEELAAAGLDVVSFHHEAVADPVIAIDKARGAGLRAGITINLETPVDDVLPYLDQVDDVMLMSIKPGWSGQTLDPVVYPRIEAVRAEVDRRGSSTSRSTAASRSTTRAGGRRQGDRADQCERHLPGG